jgi:hypothetical protein
MVFVAGRLGRDIRVGDNSIEVLLKNITFGQFALDTSAGARPAAAGAPSKKNGTGDWRI